MAVSKKKCLGVLTITRELLEQMFSGDETDKQVEKALKERYGFPADMKVIRYRMSFEQ